MLCVAARQADLAHLAAWHSRSGMRRLPSVDEDDATIVTRKITTRMMIDSAHGEPVTALARLDGCEPSALWQGGHVLFTKITRRGEAKKKKTPWRCRARDHLN